MVLLGTTLSLTPTIQVSLETRFWLKFFFRHFLEISRNWMAKMATGPGPNQTLQTRLIYKIFRSKLVHVSVI